MIILEKNKPDDFIKYNLWRCPCCDTLCINAENIECPICKNEITWKETI